MKATLRPSSRTRRRNCPGDDGGVQYFTGQWSIHRITVAAHAAGALCGFDLALCWECSSRFACWERGLRVLVHLQILELGPGAAGAFVHERHVADGTVPRFEGWWGHNAERRFLMEPEFDSMVRPKRGRCPMPPSLTWPSTPSHSTSSPRLAWTLCAKKPSVNRLPRTRDCCCRRASTTRGQSHYTRGPCATVPNFHS